MNAPGTEPESPLEVERVEWFPATPDSVRVRVVGRWRGAPPAVAPVLLVGDLSFAADEHTVADGAWRASFTAPVEIRARLERRLALRVGDAEIALPAASAGPADESSAPPPGEFVGRGVLDERRARRFEGVEGSLVRRAEAAEAEAATLRTQLEHLEQRLRDAGAERDTDRAQIAELRERVAAAERHAAELSREMDGVRREGGEALEAAVAARREAEAAARTALEREAEAARLLESIGAEGRGDRVGQLEEELERRAAMQARIGEQLSALRGELEAVREQASPARLADVEAREREARAELAEREEELVALRAELEVARREADELRDAARAADELRREAAELRRRAEEERRRRFAVEAELRAELEHEREELGARLASAEGSLRAQVAAERRAFEEQASAIERTVGELRARLVAVVGEVERRLEAERAARLAAEEELAVLRSREAEAGDLVRDLVATSTGLRDGFERRIHALEAELGERVEAEREAMRGQLAEVEAEVSRLRGELERERAGRAAAERELERGSPADLASLERAKAALTPPPEASEDLHAQARAMIRNLEDAERRLRTEREALEGTSRPVVRGPLGDLHPDERDVGEAPWDVPVGERAPSGGPAPPESLGEPARAEPADEPGPAQPTAESAPPEPAEAAESAPPAEESAAAQAAAASGPAEPAGEAAAAQAAAGSGPAEPAAPAYAEASAPPPEAAGEPPPSAAAQPTRPAAPGTSAPTGASGPATPPSRTGADPAAFALHRAAEELAAAQRAAAERAAARRAARRVGGERAARPVPVETRVVAPSDRRPQPWLTTAIARIAAVDPEMASRLLVQLLPAQGGATDRPLTYAIAIDGDGTFIVELAGRGIARLEREPREGAGRLVDVRFQGSPAALAPLAGGGAPRRLADVTTTGRWLRARRLLRARREPLSLTDLVELDVAIDPRLVLEAFAAAIDPKWTTGHNLAIDWRIEDARTTHRVVIAGGARVRIRAGQGEADATITVRRTGLLPFLARLAPPSGAAPTISGDAAAVDLLLRWTDRVQGIPEAT